MHVGAWAVPEPTPNLSRCLSRVSPAALPWPFLGIALICGFPGAAIRLGVAAVAIGLGVVAMAFGGVFGAAIAGALGGVFGAALPRAFLTAERMASATSSSVAPLAAVLFLPNWAFSPIGCRHQGGRGLGGCWNSRISKHCTLDAAHTSAVFATTCPS